MVRNRPLDDALHVELPGSGYDVEVRSNGTRRRSLTPREREVLTLLARGMTGEEAAQALAVSGETIRAHVRNSITKMRARTRLHAVVVALQRGEIEL